MPNNISPKALDDLNELKGQEVVVDTDSDFVYMGKLDGVSSQFLRLIAVDVHQADGASVSKERYLLEATRIGVRPNRKCTWVNRARVISISRLADVEKF